MREVIVFNGVSLPCCCGTLSASFQRTDSNKDGVMLLGVSKTSVGEDNGMSRTSLSVIITAEMFENTGI